MDRLPVFRFATASWTKYCQYINIIFLENKPSLSNIDPDARVPNPQIVESCNAGYEDMENMQEMENIN